MALLSVRVSICVLNLLTMVLLILFRRFYYNKKIWTPCFLGKLFIHEPEATLIL